MLLVYFLRGSVLPWYLPLSFDFWVWANLAVLFVAACAGVAGGGGWRVSWVLALSAFGLGISQAVQPMNSMSRWVGLVIMAVAIGPVIVNANGKAVRTAAWEWTVPGLMGSAGVFVVWHVFRLPNFGGGYFSAFMNQCMLAGPMAGLGGAFALARCLESRSWKLGLLSVLSVLPVLASSSRVATAATAVTYVTLVFRRGRTLGVVLGAAAALGMGAVVLAPQGGSPGSSTVSAMSSKGTTNTRADLWESRLEEFASSPLLGIGVAMGTGGGAAIESSGDIRVEPGSSYLALLAMTGLSGTVTFAVALGLVLRRFARCEVGRVEKETVIAMGVFLAVHGIAEGWILSFGSPLAFLFWLWLGKIGDASVQGAGHLSQPVSEGRRVARWAMVSRGGGDAVGSIR